MQRPTFAQFVAIAAFVVISVTWVLVAKSMGRVAGFRVAGVGLILVAAGLASRPSIPIYSGFRQIGSVRGWAKALVVAPICLMGCIGLFAT